MGRNRKVGLDYFPFDIDFFQDLKIRKLIKYQGGKAVTVYALLLCNIYKEGYYMRWDEELPFIVSEQTGYEEAYIREVIKCCLIIGLFSKELFESDKVLTSKGIQERYKEICSLSRRVINFSNYSLISSEENSISSKEKPISSEEKGITSEETPINSAKSTQSKVKKRKVNKNKVNTDKGLPLSPPDVVGKSEGNEIQKESLPISENEDYNKFRDWMSQNAPYCDNPKNFNSSRITEEEFRKLKESFTGFQIAETIMQIENRKDLRKKYTNLYRTVLNWIKPKDDGK